MKVFKFGGASIKSASAVNNMIDIVKEYRDEKLVVVVSAMGKTTNALESAFELALDKQGFSSNIEALTAFHVGIANDLVDNPALNPKVEIKTLVDALTVDLNNPQTFSGADEFYDKIVAYGERLSSLIIHAVLTQNNINTFLLSAKDVVITSNRFKEGKVNWDKTKTKINAIVKPLLDHQLVLTQGFLGGTDQGKYTTLGREGSDFTAAIFASALEAASVTIWKDVPGILNADPKLVDEAKKYDNLNYHEAAEMTYYGASVIHPKTIKPLANLNIPLLVKSFESPEAPGTVINAQPTHQSLPSTIFKKDQSLITFKVRDFTFINENNLTIIFHMLDQLNIKINMMQNSAISLSICVDHAAKKISDLTSSLKHDFEVIHVHGLNLYTVKNYNESTIDKLTENKEILLQQKTNDTFQIVVKNQ